MEHINKMIFPDWYVPQYKEKVLELANHLGRKKGKNGYTWEDPEYVILEAGVDDAMAEVGMYLGVFEKKTAAQIAEEMNKSIEYVEEQLKRLSMYGVCVWITDKKTGKDVFWLETWIPGAMEIIVNSRENCEKYPIIGYAMEAYGRVRGPKSAGAFPVGVGLMRVIPIQSSIDGNSHAASFEEVSKYLEEHDIFTVSDCSCRTDREIMGEGCGHLKEDMCIQMGDAAEYYIKTGRGREITREEAYSIIKKAEENGLMHQIPNINGNGHTHAICNCCGCGCLSLRTANMFKNNDMIRSNYVARIDKDKCVACGQCVENCPVNALKMGQKLCSSTPVVEDITTKNTPRNMDWGQDKWNLDYRINREEVVETGTSPCKSNCPAHIGVQGYIKLAAQGKHKEALELIRKDNPLPAICGRICNRRCEDACTRGSLDEPVAIDEIKKFISEMELDRENWVIPAKRHDYSDKKIAIIGGGPAGLSCAYYLLLEGYQVTIFEKEAKLGGMLTYGIPSYRLEKNVVDVEIEIIKALGLEVKTGVEVGKDITLEQLREEGYTGFYVAIGAQGGRKLGLEGETAENVISGIDFLRKVGQNQEEKIKGKVIVVGGGNVAVDVARTAVRAGADSVIQVSLESFEELPADKEEVAEAIEEAVEFKYGYGPKRLILEGEKAVGVEFVRCISVFDEKGKFNPQYDSTDTLIIEADNVLLAVGQSIISKDLLRDTKVKVKANGTIEADDFTYQTAEPDVFVGGDAFSGPKFAIDAIAAGKEGAISLHRFVQKGQSLVYGRSPKKYKDLNRDSVIVEQYDNAKRQKPNNKEYEKIATKSYHDYRGIFTLEQLQQETSRCLGCGATIVDEYMCVGCGQCTTKCKFDAIHLERVYDGEGVHLLDMKPIVVKTMIKRKGRIAVKKVKDTLGMN